MDSNECTLGKVEFEDICGNLRVDINVLGARVLDLKNIEVLQGDHGERMANIMLSYRHLEDARMRIGKILQAVGDGISILDKSVDDKAEQRASQPSGFVMIKTMMFIVIMLVLILAGCTEETKWGSGNPPAAYIETFGNEDLPRLVFVIEQRQNKLRAVIHGIDNKKEGKIVSHQPGLIDYLAISETRLKVLEDPNTATLDSLDGRVESIEYQVKIIEDMLTECGKLLAPKPIIGDTKTKNMYFDGREWVEVE